MATTPIAPPDVQVTQVIRTPTPQTASTTFPYCVIGKCTQTVPAQVSTASGGMQINAQAKTTMPAMFQTVEATGNPPIYALVANDCLVFSVTNRQKVIVRFDTSGDYTPDLVVEAIADAMEEINEGEAVAELVKGPDDPVTGIAARVRTIGRTENTTLEIDPEGRSAGKLVGSVDLTTLTFPGDVTGLTIETVIDGGSVQTYTVGSPANAAALISALSGAITGGTATLETGNFLGLASDLVGETSSIELVGGTLLAVVGFTAGDIDAGTGSTSNLLTTLGLATTDLFFGAAQYSNYALEIPPTAFPDPRGNLRQLAIETDTIRTFLSTSGGASLSETLRTTALLRKATAAVTVVDDGNADNTSPFVNLAGQNVLNPTPAAAQVTGAAAPTFASLSNKTVYLSDGRAPRAVNFGTVTNISETVNAINAVFNTSDGLIASNSGGFLRLTSTRLREDGTTLATGEDSCVVVVGGNGAEFLDSSGSPTLVVGRTTGNPHKVKVGDDLYVDGVLKGRVVQVAPSGVTTRLKLDKQLPLDFTGTTFHIVANGLESILDGGDTDRPAPNLLVAADGKITLKPGILRNTVGVVSETVISDTLYPAKAGIYVQYRALRLDMSPSSDDGLATFPDTSTIETLLEPIDETNPVGLAAYIAKNASPLLPVQALGVSAVSADQPDGTTLAHTEAAAYLEAYELYSLAVLSQDQDVNDVWAAHVTAMSAPSKKRERTVFINVLQPTRALDGLIASSSTGNTVGNAGTSFDTGLAELAQLVLEAGLNPAATIPASDGLYLDVGGDSNRYSISAISGTVLTLRTSFGVNDNTDAFYSTSGIDGTLVDVAFAVRLRGEKLVDSAGRPDKDKIAEAYAEHGKRYANKRVFLTAPDNCTVLINGIEVRVPGYYLGAAMAGLVAALPPQRSLTDVNVPGIKRVDRVKGYFKPEQLNTIAGGGIFLFHQETGTGPVKVRHALSTDVSSLESRSDNITKQLDFAAKYQRQVLQPIIGPLNVDDNTADLINTTLQSAIDFLTSNGNIKSITVREMTVVNKNEYSIEEDVEIYYPVGGVNITLFV